MVMQMCNKESALVRFKTQQYIEALENRLKQQVITAEQIAQMINEAYKKTVLPLFPYIENNGIDNFESHPDIRNNNGGETSRALK